MLETSLFMAIQEGEWKEAVYGRIELLLQAFWEVRTHAEAPCIWMTDSDNGLFLILVYRRFQLNWYHMCFVWSPASMGEADKCKNNFLHPEVGCVVLVQPNFCPLASQTAWDINLIWGTGLLPEICVKWLFRILLFPSPWVLEHCKEPFCSNFVKSYGILPVKMHWNRCFLNKKKEFSASELVSYFGKVFLKGYTQVTQHALTETLLELYQPRKCPVVWRRVGVWEQSLGSSEMFLSLRRD